MAKCKKLRRIKTEVCIGNMTKRIVIYQRVLTPPSNAFTSSSPDYTEEEVVLATVWAMVATPKPKIFFDGVSTDDKITDIFYIRYIVGITAQNWIIYNGYRYDIDSVENMDENSLFIKINAIIRGEVDKEASEA
jgi:SPP1 family predicted phage head-tail adaptor